MSSHREHIIIRNIYEMMAYAFKTVDTIEHRRLASEEFDTFEDLLAAILVEGMSRQVRNGLEHEYRQRDDDVTAIRGTIDMRKTMRLRVTRSNKINCRFDDYSADTMKNRILFTMGEFLLGCPRVNKERKSSLKRVLVFFRELPRVDVRTVDWARLRYHRNNGSYRLLMGICQMVANSRIQTMDDGNGHLATIPWEEQLPWIYEHFILEYYKRNHQSLRPNADRIDNGVEGDAPAWLPQLQTDITLHNGNRVFIIDAKCYATILSPGKFGHTTLSAGNRNQIYSYVMHKAYGNEGPVSGMLLYALTDNSQPMRSQWNETGHDFYVWTLDLGEPFSVIKEQLDCIAKLA